MSFDLTKFKVLTFDVYATLIDWETGIFAQLSPLLGRLPPSSPYWTKPLKETKEILLRRFASGELEVETANPTMKYSTILSHVFFKIAATLGVSVTEAEAVEFGAGIGKWEAFPDTVDALHRLQKFYKLIPLSNCDRSSFSATLAGPLKGVNFDAIYLAEDIGSYKPNRKNFDYMVEHVKQQFGFEKAEILHTAQSLSHDHVPAMAYGFSPSVWIKRGGAEDAMGGVLEEYEGKVKLGAIYKTLGDMADAAEIAFGVKKGSL